MKFALEAGMSMAGATLDPPDGYDCCVVEIDQKYAQTLLARIELLKELHKKDGDIYEIYYWDCSPEWFARDWDKEDIVVETGEALRTECDQLVVREGEVCWITCPKHCDVYMLSESIDAVKIAAIANGDCVPT